MVQLQRLKSSCVGFYLKCFEIFFWWWPCELYSFIHVDRFRCLWWIVFTKMHKRIKNPGWKKQNVQRNFLRVSLSEGGTDIVYATALHTSGLKWHWSVSSVHQYSSMIWQTACDWLATCPCCFLALAHLELGLALDLHNPADVTQWTKSYFHKRSASNNLESITEQKAFPVWWGFFLEQR